MSNNSPLRAARHGRSSSSFGSDASQGNPRSSSVHAESSAALHRVDGAANGERRASEEVSVLQHCVRLVARSLEVPIVQINTGRKIHRSEAWEGEPLRACPAEISVDRLPRLEETLVVRHSLADVPRWTEHPLAKIRQDLSFYAGHPLYSASTAGTPPRVIGTLCVMDEEKRRLSTADRSVMAEAAAIAEAYLQRAFPAGNVHRVDAQEAGAQGTDARGLCENEHAEALRRVQALQDIGQAILSASSAEQIAEAALQRIGLVAHFDRASVVEFDTNEQEAIVLATAGRTADGIRSGDRIDIAHFRDQPDSDSWMPRVVTNLDVEPTVVDETVSSVGIRSYLTVPLVADDEMMGVLNLGASDRYAFPPSVAGGVQEVAEMISVAFRQIRYERDLVSARDRVEEMNRLKTAFLANMSHEVRTPLTSIIGFAEMIPDEPEMAPVFAEYIRSGGKRLLQTLSAMLDFAQLESNTLSYHPERFDLYAGLEDIVRTYEREAIKKGVNLTLHASARPVDVLLDELIVRRVLLNLVDNAVKFTDRGSVDIRVTASPRSVQVEVADTGVGISETFLPHVFDEFRQESTGDTRTHEGNGLGLTITQRLVEWLGGDIQIQSKKGEGTTCTLHLPRRIPTQS